MRCQRRFSSLRPLWLRRCCRQTRLSVEIRMRRCRAQLRLRFQGCWRVWPRRSLGHSWPLRIEASYRTCINLLRQLQVPRFRAVDWGRELPCRLTRPSGSCRMRGHCLSSLPSQRLSTPLHQQMEMRRPARKALQQFLRRCFQRFNRRRVRGLCNPMRLQFPALWGLPIPRRFRHSHLWKRRGRCFPLRP